MVAESDEDVRRWLLKRFAELGFDKAEAEFLYLSAVDCHEMERLLAKGCPLEKAIAILA